MHEITGRTIDEIVVEMVTAIRNGERRFRFPQQVTWEASILLPARVAQELEITTIINWEDNFTIASISLC